MSSGLYSHTTRATGTVLTAAIYNSDHINHITNLNPTMSGGYSDNLVQHQLSTDPGGLGAEILSPNLAGELEQIRFTIRGITGKSQWYVPPVTNLESLGTAGVADGSITNAKLADMPGWTIKMRNNSAVGVPQDQGRANLTQGTAASTHSLLGFLSTNEIRRFLISDVVSLAPGAPSIPQGRLTLQANTSVMTTTQANQGTVRYTPHIGRFVPIFNGTIFAMIDIGGELTQLTTDTTKSPAAVVANSNYDILIWDDAGTKRATRGPAWTTTRGVGAGTAELIKVNGIWLNANDIVNGPLAQRGTWVGTVRSLANSLISWTIGGIGAGGAEAIFGVWNLHHRSKVTAFVQDNTDSWTYGTAAWRSANASNLMRVSYILGTTEDGVDASYHVHSNLSDIAQRVQLNPRAAGIGYDATNALAAGCSPGFSQSNDNYAVGTSSITLSPDAHHAIFTKPSDFGFHFIQAIEIASPDTGTITWYGDNGAPTVPMQNGLFFSGNF